MSIPPKLMMFFAFLLIMGKIISMGAEGVYWDTDRTETITESLTGYSVDELSGLGGIVVGASGFFGTGVPQMLLWDYSFLSSDIDALNFFLMLFRLVMVVVVSAGFIWGLVSQFQSYMIPALIGVGAIWGVGSLLS